MDLVERRKWLETWLQRMIPDPVWEELVDRKYVWAGDMPWEDEEMLVDQARSYLRVRRRNEPESDSEQDGSNLSPFLKNEHLMRRQVFALCVAVMANEHPIVKDFREEILGDSFPLTYDGALLFVDEDGYVRRDAPHGLKLQGLVETLAEIYPWKAEDASWFVLCANYIPPLPTPGVETNVTHHEHGPKFGTITLTLEPWLPAEIVARMYQYAQRRMLGKTSRQVTPTRLRLLRFIETRGKGRSWRQRMDLWNLWEARSDEEKYEDVRNFRNAYIQVRELVLEPGYTAITRNNLRAREARRRRILHDLTSRWPEFVFVR